MSDFWVYFGVILILYVDLMCISTSASAGSMVQNGKWSPKGRGIRKNFQFEFRTLEDDPFNADRYETWVWRLRCSIMIIMSMDVHCIMNHCDCDYDLVMIALRIYI